MDLIDEVRSKLNTKKKNQIQTYIELTNELEKRDGKLDKEYRKKFKSLYSMRFIKNEDEFFEYLENNYNNKNIEYLDILKKISSLSGKIEKSFSSKLLHSINHDRAIIDNNVMKRLSYEGVNASYLGIEEYINNNFDEYIEVFDKIAKENNLDISNISDIKKKDFILWILGGK